MPEHIPRFDSEEQEQAFWSESDSAERTDWTEAERVVFPNLKPSTKTISVHLPEHVLYSLKLLANSETYRTSRCSSCSWQNG